MKRKAADDVFVDWSDLDLADILGEYTEDDVDIREGSRPGKSKPSTPSTPLSEADTDRTLASKCLYKCPDCDKLYTSISGFRGHMTKKHSKPSVKATNHRVEGQKTQITETEKKRTIKGKRLISLEEFMDNVDETVIATSTAIKTDVGNSNANSRNGQKLIYIAGLVLAFTISHDVNLDWLIKPLYDVVSNLTTSVSMEHDRETMFTKFHALRINPDIRKKFVAFLRDEIQVKEEDSVLHIFIQIFLEEFLDQFIRFQKIAMVKAVAHNVNQELSKHDAEVLFYISGYILNKSVRARHGSQVNREMSSSFLAEKGTKENAKESEWTAKLDRGGLRYPKTQAYNFFVAAELDIRERVNLDQLNSTSLRKDSLIESIMECDNVKRAWSALAPGYGQGLSLCETLISLLLTVRGFAVASYVRKQVAAKQKGKKTKKALRKTLKPVRV